jgi:hypothetical protein
MGAASGIGGICLHFTHMDSTLEERVTLGLADGYHPFVLR